MAKTASLKKSLKPPSLHSRASKRAHSPPLAGYSNEKPILPAHKSILSAAPSGIQKSKKNSKNDRKTRQQRLRQAKGIERAEAVRDVRQKKMERSLGKEAKVKERGREWVDLNAKIIRQVGGGGKKKGKNEDIRSSEMNGEDGWGSDDEIMAEDANHEDGPRKEASIGTSGIEKPEASHTAGTLVPDGENEQKQRLIAVEDALGPADDEIL